MRRFRIFIWCRSPPSVGVFAPGVANASTAWARMGLELRYEGRGPGAANASTAWIRKGFEFRGAGLWPIVGNARAEMAHYSIELGAQVGQLGRPRTGR